MIHRAPFGSMERFISILIEHTGGKFPLWLAAEQFAILPISDKYNAYAAEIKQELGKHGITGFTDDRSEKLDEKSEMRKRVKFQ